MRFAMTPFQDFSRLSIGVSKRIQLFKPGRTVFFFIEAQGMRSNDSKEIYASHTKHTIGRRGRLPRKKLH